MILKANGYGIRIDLEKHKSAIQTYQLFKLFLIQQ